MNLLNVLTHLDAPYNRHSQISFHSGTEYKFIQLKTGIFYQKILPTR